MQKFNFTLLGILFCIISYGQSSSVLDANYFNQNDIQPPFKIGKGFNISDIFKQTKFCFTPESSNLNLLTNQSGQRTSIKLYYTQNDEEYNLLKSKGTSGKISYLNLFSIGGNMLNDISSSVYENTQRLVVIAKVDFGVYSFNNDPKLNDEARNLISNSKFDEFLNYYGTHYISGVRKESSIWITLTRKSKRNSHSISESKKLGAGVKIPLKPGGNFEITEGEETETLLGSSEFYIDIEVNGPLIEHGEIEEGISKILKNGEANKISGIKTIMTSTINKLSTSSENSMISQYYFTPFTLYGINTIFWDNKKEIELVKINENVIKIALIKNKLDKLTSSEGLSIVLKEYDDYVMEYDKKDYYRNQLKNNFISRQDKLKEYRDEVNILFGQFEEKYKSCSSISCINSYECCNCQILVDKSNDLLSEIRNELEVIAEIKEISNTKAIYVNTPECEKNNTASIIISNKSVNPYILYINNSQFDIIPGRTTKNYTSPLGTYLIKAVQQSGYLFSATINTRQAIMTSACSTIQLNIGFED